MINPSPSLQQTQSFAPLLIDNMDKPFTLKKKHNNMDKPTYGWIFFLRSGQWAPRICDLSFQASWNPESISDGISLATEGISSGEFPAINLTSHWATWH